MSVVIKVEELSKQYRLGLVGTATFKEDTQRWWAKLRGKEDPFLKLGVENDRTLNDNSKFVWSLKEINFDVQQGDVLGVIGRNGAGKSTLLKILSKVTAPTTGSVKVKGRIASLLEVGTGFHPELTGRENIYLNGAILGMRKSEITRKLDEIIAFAGVERYVDTPVKRYSSGMYVRLAFAVAAHLESEILIVDEVLAVGDAEFQKKCLGKMKDISKGEGRTVIFVSHNTLSIKQLCNKGILLKNGTLEDCGEIGSIIEKYMIKESLDGFNIPESLSQINTGEANFKTFTVLNQKNERIDDIFYLEEIKVNFEIEVFDFLDSILIDLKVLTNDGTEITYSSTIFSGLENITLNKGRYCFEVLLENQLMPGNYCFTLGIHHIDGTTIDYIEHIGNINVLKISKKNNDYPLNWVHGLVLSKSKWSSKQLNLYENTYI